MTLKWLWEARAAALVIRRPVLFETNSVSPFWIAFGDGWPFRGPDSLQNLPRGSTFAIQFSKSFLTSYWIAFWSHFGCILVFNLYVVFIISANVPKPKQMHTVQIIKQIWSLPKLHVDVDFQAPFWSQFGYDLYLVWDSLLVPFGAPFWNPFYRLLEQMFNGFGS